MVPKSAAVFCRPQTAPTRDWCTSLPLGPFQGLSSSGASGALSPRVSRGIFGIKANSEVFQTQFPGIWSVEGIPRVRASCGVSYLPRGGRELMKLPVKPVSSRM